MWCRKHRTLETHGETYYRSDCVDPLPKNVTDNWKTCRLWPHKNQLTVSNSALLTCHLHATYLPLTCHLPTTDLPPTLPLVGGVLPRMFAPGSPLICHRGLGNTRSFLRTTPVVGGILDSSADQWPINRWSWTNELRTKGEWLLLVQMVKYGWMVDDQCRMINN